MVKVDLHMHGPIGFQPYWLKKQGYEGKNLLEEIAKTCFRKELGICAITSDEDEIPRGSIHDRFNYLKNHFVNNLPKEYETDTLGDNVLIINDGMSKTYLVNSQTVRAKNNERQVDHLVVGSNSVPIGNSLDYTMDYAQANKLISIAEHPFCVSHGGIGKEKLEKILPKIDAIEGHNSQLIFSEILFSKIPVFKNYVRKLNKKTQEFAEQNKKPWIATSDAHRIEDAGISYIDVPRISLDYSNGEKFLNSLKNVIKSNNFKVHCEYENFFAWINWVSKFIIGTTLGKDKK